MNARTVGHYRVLEKLGEGGMGVVYKAEDTSLRRTVALKFLPPHLNQYRDRFVREAQAAAALNHPNICTIYEVDEEHACFSMEFIEGCTISERIAERPLPLTEAIDITVQTCRALQHAHGKGVVHRDIKPANLMITAGGQVKIMDFGMAQVGDRTRITKSGESLGTPAYMSPEQITGKPADRRSDIWSLGASLYEMLTARLPFQGASAQAISYNIVHATPEPPTALRSGLPVALDRVVLKALAKPPDDRYQHVEDLVVDLRGIADAPPIERKRRSWDWRTFFAGTATALALAIGFAGYRGMFSPTAPFIRPDTVITQLTHYTGTERESAISPDGRHFAFVSNISGGPDAWVRQVSGGEPLRLTNDEAEESGLVYSPDGESIYYASQTGDRSTIWRTGTLGANPTRISEDGNSPAPSPDGKFVAFLRGPAIYVSSSAGAAPKLVHKSGFHFLRFLTWSADGKWLAAVGTTLFADPQIIIVSQDGESVRSVSTLSDTTVYGMTWSSDSKSLVVSRSYDARSNPRTSDLDVLPIEGGSLRRFTLNGSARYLNIRSSTDGKRMLASSQMDMREIWKIPLRPNAAASGAGANRLLDDRYDPAFIHASGSTLLFNSGFTGNRNLWTMTLDGEGTPRQVTSLPGNAPNHSALSPDGSRIAFSSVQSGNSEVWVQNLDGSNLTQLTHNDVPDYWPAWSRDGQSIFYTSFRAGIEKIYRTQVTGGPEQLVTEGAKPDCSPMDDRIAYMQSPSTVAVCDSKSGKIEFTIRAVTAGLSIPAWSPDGKSLSLIQRENPKSDSVWIYDSSTGKGALAASFATPFRMYFRAQWTRDMKALVVNRREFISHVVLIENY